MAEASPFVDIALDGLVTFEHSQYFPFEIIAAPIAFAKRRQHSLYRAAIMLVWRNDIKLRREKRCRQTPAMVIGLLERPLLEEEVLGRRLFVTQMKLPARWDDIYWRRLRTRARRVNRGHALRYAF